MRPQDLIALGFMTFALFLGAGNVIYPPMLGQQAGYELLFAASGFLLTAVGLPLTTLISMARAGGPNRLTELLPGRWSLVFWTVLFTVIGPAFAIPRMAVVAYEMGLDPFLTNPSGWQLALYSVVFYALALLLALKPGSLVRSVGKWMTPALILLLVAIAWGTLSTPQGAVEAPLGAYITKPFSEGLIQGYMTMDCIAALGFGAVIGQSLRQLGVTDPAAMARYSMWAGLMAAVSLGLVYLMLMYLGATSHSVAPDATNGAEVLALYVAALFGLPGKLALASVITLACLTTAVGVGSACAHHFSTTLKVSYAKALVGIMVISAVVANVGLTQLIAVSVPAVVTLYPLAVALVVMGLLRHKLPNAHQVYRVTFAVVALFALVDGFNAAGLLPEAFVNMLEFGLPLFKQGLGWLLPFALTLSLSWWVAVRSKQTATAL